LAIAAPRRRQDSRGSGVRFANGSPTLHIPRAQIRRKSVNLPHIMHADNVD
jgi:hypothetical protein